MTEPKGKNRHSLCLGVIRFQASELTWRKGGQNGAMVLDQTGDYFKAS